MLSSIQNSLPIAICAFLSFFVPALAYCGVNASFFTARQIRNSLWLTAVVALAPAVCLGALAWLPLYYYAPFLPIVNGIAAFICGILICAMSSQAFHRLFPSTVASLVAELALCSLFSLLAWFSMWLLLAILCLYLFFSIYDLAKNSRLPKTLLYNDVNTQAAIDCSDIKFRQHPNIYLFYLESMHSPAAVKELYNSDLGEKLAAFLSSHGFTLYPDAHSNTDFTFDVRVNLFEMRYAQSKTCYDSKMLTPAIALEVFKSNGYAINIFDSSPFVFGVFADYANFCAFNSTLPPEVLWKFRKAAPLFAQSSFWRLFSKRIDPGELPKVGKMADCKQAFLDSVAGKASPSLNILYFGAEHTTYYRGGKKPDYARTWPIYYLKEYGKASKLLEEYVAWIEKNDPGAVMIALGDHGSHTLDGSWCLEDDLIKAVASLNPDKLFMDLFSIFLAIKWPKGKAPEYFQPTTINLFLYLFYLLSGDKELLKYKQKDISLLAHKSKNFYVVGENGKAFKEPIPFEKYKSEDFPPTLGDKYKVQ